MVVRAQKKQTRALATIGSVRKRVDGWHNVCNISNRYLSNDKQGQCNKREISTVTFVPVCFIGDASTRSKDCTPLFAIASTFRFFIPWMKDGVIEIDRPRKQELAWFTDRSTTNISCWVRTEEGNSIAFGSENYLISYIIVQIGISTDGSVRSGPGMLVKQFNFRVALSFRCGSFYILSEMKTMVFKF